MLTFITDSSARNEYKGNIKVEFGSSIVDLKLYAVISMQNLAYL